MKILVFSDSHGNSNSLAQAIEANTDAKLAIHLGDGLNEFLELCSAYNIKHYCVKGNNDYDINSSCPVSRIVTLNGNKLLLTHGHKDRVKNGLTTLALKGKEAGVNMVLYGHTHIQKFSQVAGVQMLNPGSAMGYGTTAKYAVITIEEQIEVSLLKV